MSHAVLQYNHPSCVHLLCFTGEMLSTAAFFYPPTLPSVRRSFNIVGGFSNSNIYWKANRNYSALHTGWHLELVHTKRKKNVLNTGDKLECLPDIQYILKFPWDANQRTLSDSKILWKPFKANLAGEVWKRVRYDQPLFQDKQPKKTTIQNVCRKLQNHSIHQW